MRWPCHDGHNVVRCFHDADRLLWCRWQRTFGKFTGHVRTAHDVVPVEVEKDQAMFQDTVDRVDSSGGDAEVVSQLRWLRRARRMGF